MNWSEWLSANKHSFDSRWEETFVKEVLSKVEGLSPGEVSSQTEFRDLAGGRRRIDFTIEKGAEVRIALEVDGWDKTGTNSGPSRAEFNDWSFRELSMTAAGWVPLRFANGLIKRKPEELRESIELQLKMQRKRAEAVRAGGEQARRAKELESKLEAAAKELSEVKKKGGDSHAAGIRFQKLQEERTKVEAARLSESDRVRVMELGSEIDRLNRELLDETAKRKRAEGEIGSMKLVTGLIALLVALFVVALVVINQSDGGGGETVQAALCQDAVSSSEISDSTLGQRIKVSGDVESFRRLEGDNPVVFLNLGAEYPDQDLSVVIWGEKLDNWGNIPPEDRYDGRNVAVAGELESYEGTLQIEANSPGDVVICP